MSVVGIMAMRASPARNGGTVDGKCEEKESRGESLRLQSKAPKKICRDMALFRDKDPLQLLIAPDPCCLDCLTA